MIPPPRCAAARHAPTQPKHRRLSAGPTWTALRPMSRTGLDGGVRAASPNCARCCPARASRRAPSERTDARPDHHRRAAAQRAQRRRDRRHDRLRREREERGHPRDLHTTGRRHFPIWCFARSATPQPAHQGIVAAYLSSLADAGKKAATIGRRAASIAYHHKIAGHEPPTNAEGVKATLRGIRRTTGTARAGKAPATADVLMQMVALCPDNMIGRRDRALLALGFAGAFRRSELCALEVADFVGDPTARACRVGLEVWPFSDHSLRSGFLTSAAETGANVFKMAEVSRHRSLDTLRGYVRRVECSRNMRERRSCEENGYTYVQFQGQGSCSVPVNSQMHAMT